MTPEKKRQLEVTTARVVSACLLAGTKVSTAYELAAKFASAVEAGVDPESLQATVLSRTVGPVKAAEMMGLTSNRVDDDSEEHEANL